MNSEQGLAHREHYLKVGEDGTTKVVHRVAIFDARGCITSVISQLDVMRCAAAKDRNHTLFENNNEHPVPAVAKPSQLGSARPMIIYSTMTTSSHTTSSRMLQLHL